MKSKYITKDDFKEYFGIDLEVEMKDDDNPSNKVNAFLVRVENRMEAYLNAHFYQNIEVRYPTFSDYQKEHYKRALLEQAYYVLTQGDISVDSGYEMNEGVKINQAQKRAIIMCDNAIDELILVGVWNRHIRGNVVGGGFDGWWLF